ncbi:MAG TPA: molybdopterin-dependent oxidoreductase [Thermodesulfobacteriota bacterium]|nr:molybdopterin-dependent oxidoreductase [Thermodesulfobacteriota bacterium]
MARLTIDGKQIEAQEGKALLEVALENGIYIPSLCYLSNVAPIGSCRVCLVEVEGVEKPVASCTTPAVDGLKVKTQSEKLTELRKNALQLMLINHPLDCPVCDKAGECRLQDLTYELGITSQAFELEKTPPQIDYLSPLIERNESRCIRCGRCVSVCYEVQGCGAYRFNESGYKMAIDTIDGGPLNCDFCGQCITVCPVGAILNKLFKYRSRAWELEKVATVCPYCGAGCRIKLHVKQGKVFRVTPDEETVTGFGSLCSRGTFGFGFVHNRDRLHTPLIFKNKELVPVPWDEALDFVAQRLETIKKNNGPEAIVGLGSPRATNEDNYLFQKFFRQVLGSNNLDSYARNGYVKAIEALQSALGMSGSTFTFDQVEDADAILTIGTDLSVEMPVPSLKVIRAAREGKAKLINCYPRENKLDRFAHMRLRYYPGTEIALLSGMAKVIIEKGLENKQFINSSTESYDAFVKLLQDISPADVSRITGVDEKVIAQAAITLAQAKKVCILFGYDLITQASGKEAVFALTNLALLTGIVREGSGLYLVTEKNNLRGVVEMGVVPEKAFGKDPPSKPGKTFPQMIDAMMNGEIKALYVMGADPLVEFPNSAKIREAMNKLELVVVQDILPAEVMEFAHCVLPAVSFAEKDGTFTSSDGKVQKVKKAIECYRNARPDWEIISELSNRMGVPMKYRSADEITEEINTVLPGYADGSMVKPFQGKGKFIPVPLPPKEGSNEYPYTLMIGPTLFHCGTLSTYAEGPNILAPEAWLEISPEDLKKLDLNSGDAVRVTSPQASVQVKTKVNTSLSPGTLFMPLHFRDVKANLLNSNSSLVQVNVERC